MLQVNANVSDRFDADKYVKRYASYVETTKQEESTRGIKIEQKLKCRIQLPMKCI